MSRDPLWKSSSLEYELAKAVVEEALPEKDDSEIVQILLQRRYKNRPLYETALTKHDMTDFAKDIGLELIEDLKEDADKYIKAVKQFKDKVEAEAKQYI